MRTVTESISALYNKAENNEVIKKPARSEWGRGVQFYAIYLLDIALDWNNEENAHALRTAKSFSDFEKILLNGASSWKEFSYGCCALIYDEDIACKLCNPSELKRTKNGERNPNKSENWLDCQTRALYQSSRLLYKALHE